VSDFIEEVEGQLRSERYREMAGRVLPWFLAALIAVVAGWLGVWGYRAWQDRNVSRASVQYDKGLTALAQGDETGAFTDFAALGKSGPAGYRTLALIQEGNIRLAASKTDEAAAFYDEAAKAAPNKIFGDLARLKAAQSLLDTAPYPQLQTRLAVLTPPDRPFSLEAREALAMAKLAAGKTAEARGDLNALTLTLGVGQSMSQRLKAAIATIDSGQAGMVPQVVRAAATLPPPSRQTVPAAQPGETPSEPAAAPPQSDSAAAGNPQ
jgi:hypothetical protein